MTYPPSRMRRALCNIHSNGPISFRPAQAADTDRILSWLRSDEAQRHIHWHSSSNEEERRRVLEWVEDPEAIFLLLRHRGEEVGFLQLEHLDEHRRLLWLSLIVLAPRFIGKGIGTEALRLLLSRIYNTNAVDRILLAVNSDNTRAVSAYQRLGFVLIDSRRHVRSRDGKDINQNIMECSVRWHAPAHCHCLSSPVHSPSHGGG